jgi:RNA polymerase sigma-70 factor (ECF subfamily)
MSSPCLVRKLPDFQYDREKRFRAWLWTVTLNKHREKRPRAVIPVQTAGESALGQLAGPEEAVELDEAEYRQYLVQRALKLIQAEFQPTTWKAFWEYVVADRPSAEVAAELKLSLDVVYAAKSRVLRRLRKVFLRAKRAQTKATDTLFSSIAGDGDVSVI